MTDASIPSHLPSRDMHSPLCKLLIDPTAGSSRLVIHASIPDGRRNGGQILSERLFGSFKLAKDPFSEGSCDRICKGAAIEAERPNLKPRIGLKEIYKTK